MKNEQGSVHDAPAGHGTGPQSAQNAGVAALQKLANLPVGWINAAVVWVIGLMAFFLPFVYGNWTVEFIRYNKTVFLIAGTLIVLVLWAIKILLQGEIRLKKTVLDIPILLLVGAATLAVIMSQVSDQSIWGAFPNFEDSYVLFMAVIVCYYALINHIREGSDWLLVLGMVLASAALLGIITLLQYYEVYLLPLSDISNARTFSPFGTITQVATFLSVLVPVAGGLMIGSIKHKRWFLTILTLVVLVLSMMIVGMVNYWVCWIIVAIGTLGVLGVSLPVLKGTQRNLAFIPLAVFVLSLVVYKVPALRDNLVPAAINKPVVMELKQSLDIAQESVKKYAIAGVGQSNYGLAYKMLRPANFNTLDDWLLNYNRPFNQYFLVLTTMGLAGILALGYFTLKMFGLVGKAVLMYSSQKDADPAVLGLLISIVCYFFVLLLSWETIPLMVTFWILLVLAVYVGFEPDISGITGDKVFALKFAGSEQGKQRDFLSIGTAVGLLVLVLVVGYRVAVVYSIDMDLRSAINYGNDGDTNNSLINQNKVVSAKDAQDYHLRGVAILLHNQGIAAEISQESEEQQAQDIERKRAFFTEAVRYAQRATASGPKSSENWEVLLGIYSTLGDYAIQKIDNVPMTTLMTEIRTNLTTLTPTEVTWRLRLANFFIKQEDYDTAITLLGQANILKTNLVDIHYLAAKAFGGQEDYENAVVEANIALRSLDPEHTWTTELNSLVKDWEQAQAAETKANTKTEKTTTTTETTEDTETMETTE